jgi:uncharacterized delta-60 repeat protein
MVEQLESRLQFAAGSLDPTFYGGGTILKVYRSTSDFIDVARQADGKLVAVGDSFKSGQTRDGLIVRYNKSGSTDTTFGAGGIVNLNFSSTVDDIINAVAIQGDGKIVVAGTTGNGTSTDMFVARYLKTGAPDTGFGSGGKLKIDFGKTDAAFGLVIQTDGKIVLSGFSGSISSLSMAIALARVTTAGKLDTTFDGDGKATTSPGTFGVEIGARMALQSDGKFLVAITKVNASIVGVSSLDAGVARFTTAGKLDTTFDGDGRAFADFGGKVEIGTSVAIDPTTKNVVLGGVTANGILEFGGGSLPGGLSTFLGDASAADYAVARFKFANGALDTSFSTDGRQTVAFKVGSTALLDGATDVQVDSAGKVYLTGASKNGSLLPDFSAARLTKAGALDTTFSGDGMAAFDLGGSDGSFGSLWTPAGLILVGHAKSINGLNFAALIDVLTA